MHVDVDLLVQRSGEVHIDRQINAPNAALQAGPRPRVVALEIGIGTRVHAAARVQVVVRDALRTRRWVATTDIARVVAGQAEVGPSPRKGLGVPTSRAHPHTVASRIGRVIEVGGVGSDCGANCAEICWVHADVAVLGAGSAVGPIGVVVVAYWARTIADVASIPEIRDAFCAVVSCVDASCAIDVAEIAGMGRFVCEITHGTARQAGTVNRVEKRLICAVRSAGRAIVPNIVAGRTMEVAEDTDVGDRLITEASDAGLVAGVVALPHRDGAVAQAGPALSGCWAVAGSAGRVAAPVDHNELL